MKTIKLATFFGILIGIALTSCSIEKRVHMSGYHIEWKLRKHNNVNQETINDISKDEVDEYEDEALESSSINLELNEENNPRLSENNSTISIEKENQDLIINHFENESNQENYSKSTLKKEFVEGSKRILENSKNTKINGFALTGFICSLLGLFIFGIIFGLLAIIFSSIGLAQIIKDSDKWTGKGIAIAGIIIGIVDIFAWLILVALLL